MTTTFEKWSDFRANYSDRPTVDVEILPDVRHCDKCDALLKYEPGRYGMGKWLHVVEPAEEHYIRPKTRCKFCNSEEHATYHQFAWHDSVDCTRCGGRDGYAIGD